MIDLYYWPTPNGWKVSAFLEEAGLEYRVIAVNIGRGEQFAPEFLKISPNNRMPAIVDHAPADGGAPISVFESGAILVYLAEKTGRFMPRDLRGRNEVMQWVMWQMGGLGPMMGQANHFQHYAPEKIEYGVTRYTNEVARLLGVIERRLDDRDYLAGEYSIADMMSWPWAILYKRLGLSLEALPKTAAWIDRLSARPALQRGKAVGSDWQTASPVTDAEARKILFGIK
ncbi:MAG: glutathione S-transferase N-terminal domain-containing protein [Myxococcales bacterium]|nr:glutathione S-transferase N-terminal domain-containing protein [Myxococcales bacterium]